MLEITKSIDGTYDIKTDEEGFSFLESCIRCYQLNKPDYPADERIYLNSIFHIIRQSKAITLMVSLCL